MTTWHEGCTTGATMHAVRSVCLAAMGFLAHIALTACGEGDDGSSDGDAAPTGCEIANGQCRAVKGTDAQCYGITASVYDAERGCTGRTMLLDCIRCTAPVNCMFPAAVGCYTRQTDSDETEVRITSALYDAKHGGIELGDSCDSVLYGEATGAPSCQ